MMLIRHTGWVANVLTSASIVYSQRCKEAFPDVPVILGGIEASLRRIAHFDYWQEKVRRSILMDATADMLLYGNAERAIVEVAHRPLVRRRNQPDSGYTWYGILTLRHS